MLLRVRRRRRTSVGAAALDTHLTRPTSQPPVLDVPLPSPCDLFGQRSFLKMPQMESGDCQTRQSHEPQLEMWCRHKFFFSLIFSPYYVQVQQKYPAVCFQWKPAPRGNYLRSAAADSRQTGRPTTEMMINFSFFHSSPCRGF